MELPVVLFFVTVITTIGDTKAQIVWTDKYVNELFSNSDVDTKLTTPELISRDGYIPETHRVTTTDGYVLTMHRIRASPRYPVVDNKPVVFLMHGILTNSINWIIMGPSCALGYLLADAGYDVWMGNARGNTYSKNHETIVDLNGAHFWDFSWHEIGIYDLPAMIDYILKITGQNQLGYVGHSQGTTVYYVLCSQRPEYNRKIKIMVSLAPIAYMNHVRSPIVRLAALNQNPLDFASKLFGVNEFLPKTEQLARMTSVFCNVDALTERLCENTMFLIYGFNERQLNTTLLPHIIADTPSGGSVKQLAHYAQEMRSGRFCMFDYGPINNLIAYHHLTPTSYNMKRVTSPVHLIYSDGDYLSGVTDVLRLASELKNVVGLTRVEDPKWGHVDYLYGIDAKKLVHDKVLSIIRTYFS